MLKWFSANSKNIQKKVDSLTVDSNLIDNDDLQKARYRLIGASVLFLSVLLSLPFLVKSQNYTNKTLNMKLINEQNNDIDSENYHNSSKTFKKVPMEKIENISPNHKQNLKKNNSEHIENSTNINTYYEYYT